MAHAEIDAIRAMLAAGPPPPTLQDLRAMYDGLGALFPTAADVTLSPGTVAGQAVEWTSTPAADANRVLLYLHGGGYVIGSLASHRHLAAELGRACGTRTLAVDYRLAPEHAYPAAVDDALAAYRHLLYQGIKPGHIAIAGDSAGGGLTVATLLAIKAAGLAQPACGVCISPWVDLEAKGASMDGKSAEDPMVQRQGLLDWAGLYLNGADPKSPTAAPIYGDLTGLAPLLIQVGSAETLLDDSIRLAGVAGAAEVDVKLEVWPQMIHVWHFFYPMLTEARTAIVGAGAFVRGKMG